MYTPIPSNEIKCKPIPSNDIKCTPIPSNEIKYTPILAIKYRYNLTPLLLKTGNIEGTPIHIMQKKLQPSSKN